MLNIRVGNDKTDRCVRLACSLIIGYLAYYGFR